MLGCGRGEGVGDCFPGNTGVCGEVQQVSGVVVEPADDLGVVPGSQCPVGEVGLPGLVRAVGLEPDEGAAGPFLRLRGDGAGSLQDPSDRRPGRGATVPVEVGEDRVGTSIQTCGGQLVPQLNDPGGDLWRGLVRG